METGSDKRAESQAFGYDDRSFDTHAFSFGGKQTFRHGDRQSDRYADRQAVRHADLHSGR
jgi:hypothetical protein